MGQKVNPVGLRIGVNRGWNSRWFNKRNYAQWLHEDLLIKDKIRKKLKNSGISSIEVERPGLDKIRLIIKTSKPGIVIGKKGAGIDDLKVFIEKIIGKPVNINVNEIKNPELHASIVAQNIVEQLEKRVAFRRAMKQAIFRSMKAGAQGIKVQCSGRLAGAEIARTEHAFEGKVPLHTLRADIDYALVEAYTTYGRIGVKVWIYKGDILSKKAERAAKNEQMESAQIQEVTS